MEIHFVCSGNYYRSRIAEAYLKSKHIPGFEITSSGTRSNEDYLQNGPISWYAMRIIKNNGLIPFLKKLPDQTTEEMLKNADLVIFMSQSHYDFAKNNFHFTGNHQIWDIPDLDQFKDSDTDLQNDCERIKATEEIFRIIKKKIDALVTQEA